MNNLKNLEEVSNKQVNLPVLLSFPHQSIYFNSCLYYFEVTLFKILTFIIFLNYISKHITNPSLIFTLYNSAKSSFGFVYTVKNYYNISNISKYYQSITVIYLI